MFNQDKLSHAKVQSTRRLKRINDLSFQIIGAAIEVHKTLGPGLLESIYQKALAHELHDELNLQIEIEKPIDVIYKSKVLNNGFRIDILVEDLIIIELKSVSEITKLHEKQLMTYLKITDKRLGLLINFNEELLMQGIKRIANKL